MGDPTVFAASFDKNRIGWNRVVVKV